MIRVQPLLGSGGAVAHGRNSPHRHPKAERPIIGRQHLDIDGFRRVVASNLDGHWLSRQLVQTPSKLEIIQTGRIFVTEAGVCGQRLDPLDIVRMMRIRSADNNIAELESRNRLSGGAMIDDRQFVSASQFAWGQLRLTYRTDAYDGVS